MDTDTVNKRIKKQAHNLCPLPPPSEKKKKVLIDQMAEDIQGGEKDLDKIIFAFI